MSSAAAVTAYEEDAALVERLFDEAERDKKYELVLAEMLSAARMKQGVKAAAEEIKRLLDGSDDDKILKKFMQANGVEDFFDRAVRIQKATFWVLAKMSEDAVDHAYQSCINLPPDFDETKRKHDDDEASSHAKKKRKMDNDDDVVVIDLIDDDDEKSDTVAPSGDEEAYDSGSHSPPMPASPLLPPPSSPPQSPQASPKRERDDEVVDMPQSKKIKMDDASVVDKSSEELPGLDNDLAEGMGAKQWKRKRRHWNPELLEKYEFRVAQTEGEVAPPGVFLIKNLDPEQVWNNDCGCNDLMHYFDFTASFRDKAVYCTPEANKFEEMVDELANNLGLARDMLRDGINRWLKYMCSPDLGWKMSTMPCDDYLQLRYMLLTVDWIFPELKKRGKLFKKFNEVWQERHDDLKAIREEASASDSDYYSSGSDSD